MKSDRVRFRAGPKLRTQDFRPNMTSTLQPCRLPAVYIVLLRLVRTYLAYQVTNLLDLIWSSH